MSTYVGVIAASQKRCNCGAERLTDLYIEQDIYYLTSLAYPVDTFDALSHSISIPDAITIRTIMKEELLVENLRHTIQLNNVTMRDVRITYGPVEEELGHSIQLNNITLTSVMRNTTMPPESLTHSSSVGSITRKRVLLDIPPINEAIEHSAYISSITLT